MKGRILAVIVGAVVFVLAVLLVWVDLEFETFNFVEGIYWLNLGVLAATLREIVAFKYTKLALFATVIFVLFGITDFIEITTGAYWEPWWLFVCNILCVAGIITSLVWYLKLRFFD